MRDRSHRRGRLGTVAILCIPLAWALLVATAIALVAVILPRLLVPGSPSADQGSAGHR